MLPDTTSDIMVGWRLRPSRPRGASTGSCSSATPWCDATRWTDGVERNILEENDSRLLAFGLSFAVIARYWILHHQLFETMDGYTQPLLRLNMLWLATIVFLPSRPSCSPCRATTTRPCACSTSGLSS